MAVAKHNADGSLDNSFAGDGVASFPSGRAFGVARRVDFHRSDGLILAGSIREEGGYAELPYFACVDELNTKGHRKKTPIWNALALATISAA
ncbi:MAG: hypothetical protein O7C75_01890 [Verrucomicrobia bacterium]|nr:hypothetical protein [Verrucomicrobiota bacterium]